MNKARISIVTVCFNAADTIEKTILSVINQTYDNIEYIIIDGASTDGTVEIIKKYESQISLWVSEPDKGIYDAMNKAVLKVHGDYYFFLNCGDVFYTDTVLSNISDYLLLPNTIYYGNVIQFPNIVRYDGAFSKWKLSVNNICHQSIFYPNSVFCKYNYNTGYRPYADWDLNLRCFGDDDFSFKYIDQIISVYDINGVSSSYYDPPFWHDYFRIVRSNLGLIYAVFAYIVAQYVRSKRFLYNYGVLVFYESVSNGDLI